MSIIKTIDTPLGKIKDTGDLLGDIAHEIETYMGDKLLSIAPSLGDKMGLDGFCLGGVALRIKEESLWVKTHKSFEDYVNSTFGFSLSTAQRFMLIYHQLTHKQIPWGSVKHLGWTKIFFLAKVLTLENLDDWVAKAENLAVPALQNAIKGGDSSKENDSLGSTNAEKPDNNLTDSASEESPQPDTAALSKPDDKAASAPPKPPVTGDLSTSALSNIKTMTAAQKVINADIAIKSPLGKHGMVTEVIPDTSAIDKAEPDIPLPFITKKDMVAVMKEKGSDFVKDCFEEAFPEIAITFAVPETKEESETAH